MMGTTRDKAVQKAAGAPSILFAKELASFLSNPIMLGGEREQDYEQLRMAHVDELKPRTHYQRSLVEDLVRYEWEAHRHRRLRDRALLAKYHEIALSMLMIGEVRTRFEGESVEEAELLADDLISPDPSKRREAEMDFANLTGHDPEAIIAQAYYRCPVSKVHENKIADLERRRRAVRDEYAKLATIPTANIDDAQMIAVSDG